jgi:hypothetical protein
MVKLQNTKKVLTILLVSLLLASALRVKTRQEDNTETNQVAAEVSPNSAINMQSVDEEAIEQATFFAAADSLRFYETHIDTLGATIADSGANYYRVDLIHATDGTTDDQETDMISYPDSTVNDLVRDEYRRVRDEFDFYMCHVYIFSNSFFIILDTDNGDVTTRWNDMRNIIDLESDYRDVNDAFDINQDVYEVSDFQFIYYLNEGRDDVESREYNVVLTTIGGSYTVESLSLDLRTILIKQPSDNQHGTYVSYQFSLDLENGFTPTANTQGMQGSLPIHADLWSSSYSFDSDHPQFRFDVSPVGDQINVDLLLSLLDEGNYVDQRISTQLGENEDEPFVSTVNIAAPKGLDSLNNLPVTSAYFTSNSGDLEYLFITPNCPDFAFLPLELTTTSNNCEIVYVSSNNVHVRIEGEVMIEGSTYSSLFRKENDDAIYNITLFGEQGSSLTFSELRRYLFPTMEVTPHSTILTTDPDSLQRLSSYGITEDNTVIEDPVIDVSYETYLMYSVRGRIRTGEELVDRVVIQADFVNLDGAILSYARFIFSPSVSTSLFHEFFNSNGGQDAGFDAFRIQGFQLVSVNRDFNADSVTQIRHSNVFVSEATGVMISNGITVILQTDVEYNCGDNLSCRLLKDIGVQTALNFTGAYSSSNTTLSAEFSNFTLDDSRADFGANTLHIDIAGEDTIFISLVLNGQMTVDSEPDNREIIFEIAWTFSNDPAGNITLTGTKHNVYEDVFRIGVFDILEGRISGSIDPESQNVEFDFLSTSVVGHDCYTLPEYIDELNESENSPESRIFEFDSAVVNEDGSLNIVSGSCLTGKSHLDINTHDLESTTYRAHFNFDGYQHFIQTVFRAQPDDTCTPLVDMINFPQGVSTSNEYSTVHDRDYTIFTGENEFLGITTNVEIEAYLDSDRVEATLYLPSFSIGGGNLQFYNEEDILERYQTNNNHYCRGRLDCFDSEGSRNRDRSNFEDTNSLHLTFDTQNTIATNIQLNANAILFEMLQRFDITLDQSRWQFIFNGRPFRGALDAETIVEVIPVDDLVNEDHSAVEVTIDQNENYFRLETYVNVELQSWVSNIVVTRIRLDERAAELEQLRTSLENIVEQSSLCDQNEQCQDIPTIRCDQYAQNAVCVQETQICSTVTQTCVQAQTFEYSWGSYEICTEFDTVCMDDEPRTVCLEYELHDIPDECIAMELSCTRVIVANLDCANDYETAMNRLSEVEARLAMVYELQILLETLFSSSTCMIRLTSNDDRDEYPDCSLRHGTIEGIPDSIEILELFSLRSMSSIMRLRDVVSSDSMIFESDVSLYGDWHARTESDRIIMRNNVDPSREDERRGYDLGIESLLFVDHIVDFISLNRTSYEISESVKQVVCREHNLQGSRSSRAQVLLRELSLLNGRHSICQDIEIINNQDIESVDEFGVPQPSVYSTYQSDDAYVSSTASTLVDSQLTFSYQSDELLVPTSTIREDYDTGAQYYITDDLANSLIYRIEQQDLELSRNREFTQRDRLDQADIDEDYVEDLQREWTDQAQDVQEEQVDLDDLETEDETEYEDNQDEQANIQAEEAEDAAQAAEDEAEATQELLDNAQTQEEEDTVNAELGQQVSSAEEAVVVALEDAQQAETGEQVADAQVSLDNAEQQVQEAETAVEDAHESDDADIEISDEIDSDLQDVEQQLEDTQNTLQDSVDQVDEQAQEEATQAADLAAEQVAEQEAEQLESQDQLDQLTIDIQADEVEAGASVQEAIIAEDQASQALDESQQELQEASDAIDNLNEGADADNVEQAEARIQLSV